MVRKDDRVFKRAQWEHQKDSEDGSGCRVDSDYVVVWVPEIVLYSHYFAWSNWAEVEDWFRFFPGNHRTREEMKSSFEVTISLTTPFTFVALV